MEIQQRNSPSRAIVLGGGGVTGIAWEVGVLVGLLESGVDLHKADTVIGTSAGSFVGVALASGYDMNKLFSAQSEPTDYELRPIVSKELASAWYQAFAIGGAEPQKVGAAFGDIAKKNPEPIPPAQRRLAVEGRLVTKDWPKALQITAIDADSGKLHVFNHTSGIALIDAVSASGAVPGIWPLVQMNGRVWTDGGMVSTTNAHLADGYERVIILAPMPDGHGLIPGAIADAAALSDNACVYLVTPDEKSVEAIGPNPYDPSRRSMVSNAGRTQGASIAKAIQDIW